MIVALSHDSHGLVIEVRDNGIGLPKGFDIERTNSLGLSIVRDLVVSQLDGSIDMRRVGRPDGGGTLVRIEVPTGPRVSGEARPQPTRRRAASHTLRSLRRSSSDVPAPHAGLLVGGEGEVQARLLDGAVAAHPLGRLDLVDGRAGRPDGEEEVRHGVSARREPSPVVGVPLDGAVPHQRHDQVLHPFVIFFTSPATTVPRRGSGAGEGYRCERTMTRGFSQGCGIGESAVGAVW